MSEHTDIGTAAHSLVYQSDCMTFGVHLHKGSSEQQRSSHELAEHCREVFLESRALDYVVRTWRRCGERGVFYTSAFIGHLA